VKAIVLMFDSLNRHLLPPYGGTEVIAPNFARLASRATTFDRAYAGSLPCMPARRELHTGRYNFLHRSWGPLEPYDDSMPELLGQAGVHTHLVSDHPHYWEDGGATYHTRYTTWEFFRGQEGDPWKGIVAGGHRQFKAELQRQDRINRQWYADEADHPQTRTVDAGLDFVRDNADADRWLVQIECFDPHEPFAGYPRYRELYPPDVDGVGLEWPEYGPAGDRAAVIDQTRNQYAALVTMCDHSLGRVLDLMDTHGLWDDTMLIVNTDHGFLLGEHGRWAKSVQPWFEELVHLPLFVWDPRSHGAGDRRDDLVRTIDLAPTLLSYFGAPPAADAQGRDLAADGNCRGALFGIHGGHVNVTDGRYVYLRAAADESNQPLEEYTLMPTHMRGRFSPAELRAARLAPPFGFSKQVPMLALGNIEGFVNSFHQGTLLYDLDEDPWQQHPIVDDELELRMLALLRDLLDESEAPTSQYERLGIPQYGELGTEHLLAQRQRDAGVRATNALPPLEEVPALRTQVNVALSIPAVRELVLRRLPALGRTEVVNSLTSLTLYAVAHQLATPAEEVRSLAADLSDFADRSEKCP
jgi:arylsulfatase A-like enzyme